MANSAAANVEGHAASALENAIAAGNALHAAKSQVAHGQWLNWLAENWGFSQRLAHHYMKISNSQCVADLTASGINEALRIIDNDKADSVSTSSGFECEVCGEIFDVPVKHCVVCGGHETEHSSCECSEETDEEYEVEEEFDVDEEDEEEEDSEEDETEVEDPRPEVNEFIVLGDWQSGINLRVKSDKKFNKQDTSSIEWARWSWNPVTGCKHDCPYCYARDIANRFYEQKFEPSIWPSRFSAPYNTKVPVEAERDISYKNVFTGSMTDLFGKWVPDEWIEEVVSVVDECDQWNFLFLTKFPQRVHQFDMPTNAWMGTTVDCQDRVANAEKAFGKIKGGTKWLSVEPMLTPLRFSKLHLFDWVVVGGSSRSSTTPAWVPPIDWVVDLHKQCRDAGCKIYYKDNMGMGDSLRIKEFPWSEPEEKVLPQSLRYLQIGK